jgi:cell division protein FtsL
MAAGQIKKSRALLKRASKIDKTDPITLELVHELHRIGRLRTAKLKEEGVARENSEKHAVEYKVGNETIIQPAVSSYKENGKRLDIVNIGIGILIAALVMVFLVLPQVSGSSQKKVNKDIISFSEQIETQKAQISALKEELEKYRMEVGGDEQEAAVSTSVKDSYEIVMTIKKHFDDEDMSDADMVAELLKVNVTSLGENGKAIYDTITATVYPRYSEKIYREAKASYEAEDYQNAKQSLDKVVAMNSEYANGEAKQLLDDCNNKLNANSEEEKGQMD